MLRIGLRGGVVGAIVMAAGCTTGAPPSPSEQGSDPSRAPYALPTPDVSSIDTNKNRVDDELEVPSAPSAVDEEIAIEAVFSRPMPVLATAELARLGGHLRHVYRTVSYGFSGKLPRSKVAALATALGPDLLVVKGEHPIELHLDRATKASRAREVWRPGFAGSAAGFSGSSSINIAIVDAGVDPTHPDLAGRLVGWKDYTSDANGTASDTLGHGTHVAGIALGSGAAFGVGPGTLSFTDSGTVADLDVNGWNGNAMEFPPTFTLTSTATFFGGGSTVLSVLRGDLGKTVFSNQKTGTAGTSPVTLSFDGAGTDAHHFTLGLRQNAAKDVTRYAVASKVTNYPAAGDGYPVLRGVASRSGYYAAKIFPSGPDATGTSADINEALDDIGQIAQSLNIKVVNCSFGLRNGATDPTQRAKVNALVDLGIVVVSSSGNNGPTGATGDPGRAAKTLTVGAVNDINEVAAYSSGSALTAADTDSKPDLVAPGGSAYRTKILAPDSNSGDASGSDFGDVQANDYTSILGTSMAAPLVAGSAALVIEALESKGHVWSWGKSDSPMLVKMLLTASATETNALRESNSNNPTLGRAQAPKDQVEGYGMVNVDAAVEAATMTWDFGQPVTGSTDGSPNAKRAWGRKVKIPAGRTMKLALTPSAAADFDVYVYRATPTANGLPRLNAWSDRDGVGVSEETTWHFEPETELYVFVKRISGSGSFTLSGNTFTCGNGTIEPGEECDDGNTTNGDCCSVACQLESAACASDAGTVPQGNVDAGPNDAGADADADAEVPPGVAPDGAAPPLKEPEPVPTAPPVSTTPPASTAPSQTAPVEQLDPGGGGCTATSHGSSGFGASLGLVIACALAARRRRRAG